MGIATEKRVHLALAEQIIAAKSTGKAVGYFSARINFGPTEVRADLCDEDAIHNGQIVLSADEYGRLRDVLAHGRRPLRARPAVRLEPPAPPAG